MWYELSNILNQSTNRITGRIAEFLPSLVALLVILALSIGIALAVRIMLRRSLQSINFDKRLEQWGFSAMVKWSPSRSPTRLVARLAFWAIILVGFLFGLSALDAKLTSELALRLFTYLPNVVAAIFVLAVGFILAQFVARAVLISAVNMQIQSASLLSLGVKWLVLVLAGAMALEHLRIGGGLVQISFAILFGGIVFALALAVGLGSKDVVSRTWERQSGRSEEHTEERFHHL
jgi:hypothetical protein